MSTRILNSKIKQDFLATLNAESILKRVATTLGLDRQKDIARALHMSDSDVTNWKKSRRQIPFVNLLIFAQSHRISLDWLLTGKAKTRVVNVQVTEDGKTNTRVEWADVNHEEE